MTRTILLSIVALSLLMASSVAATGNIAITKNTTGAQGTFNFSLYTAYNTINLPNSWGIAINQAGNLAYVSTSNQPTSNVVVINLVTNTVINSFGAFQGDIYGIALNPASNKLYIYTQNSVKTISTVTNSVINTITVGGGGFSLAVNPSGTFAYLAQNNNVVVINLASNSIANTITGFNFPTGIAVAPNGNYLYVTNFQGDGLGTTVSVVSTSTNQITGTITGLLNGVDDVAFTPSGQYAYVTSIFFGFGSYQIGGYINIVNTTSQKPFVAVLQGGTPSNLAFGPSNLYAYITNNNGDATGFGYVTKSNITLLSITTLGGSGTSIQTVPTGTYRLNETINPTLPASQWPQHGWIATNAFCNGANTIASIGLTSGATVSCTFDNWKIPFAYTTNGFNTSASSINVITPTAINPNLWICGVAEGNPTGDQPNPNFKTSFAPDVEDYNRDTAIGRQRSNGCYASDIGSGNNFAGVAFATNTTIPYTIQTATEIDTPSLSLRVNANGFSIIVVTCGNGSSFPESCDPYGSGAITGLPSSCMPPIIEDNDEGETAALYACYLSGSYLVTAFSGAGTDISIASYNFGTPTVTLSAAPLPSGIDAGNTITFTASENGGSGPFAYTFYIYNAVTKSTVNTVTQSSNTFVFATNAALVGSTLNANVFVTDGEGSTANSVLTGVFTVNALPTISIAPLMASIGTGQSVTFTNTTAHGTGPFEYAYSVNPATGTLIAGNTITFADAGTYNVSETVSDAAGAMASSANSVITVSGLAPSTTTVPQSIQQSGGGAPPSTTTATTTLGTKTVTTTVAQAPSAPIVNYTYNLTSAPTNITIAGIGWLSITSKIPIAVLIRITNVTSSTVPLGSNSIVAAFNVVAVTSQNVTLNSTVSLTLTLKYPCAIAAGKIAPYELRNGNWTQITPFTVSPQLCTIAFAIQPDPIVALFESVAENTTTSIAVTSTVPPNQTTTIAQKQQTGKGDLEAAAAAVVALIIVAIAYLIWKRTKK